MTYTTDNTLVSKGQRAAHTAYMRLRHLLKAGYWRGHHIHSPFVFHIVRDVITVRKPGDESIKKQVRRYRNVLYNDNGTIVTPQIGAISDIAKPRKISQIARNTSTTEKYGRLLARLATDLQSNSILELGTSLGVSTAYLAAARPNAKIVTIEGLDEVANIAEKNFRKSGFDNVTLLRGDIAEKMDEAISLLPNGLVDLAFIDGNHSKTATLDYFEAIAAHHAPMCVLIFDDIYWSQGMTEAWNSIVTDARVDTTIELAQWGLAFFRTGCQKEHYIVRW